MNAIGQETRGGARIGSGPKPKLETRTIEQICRLSCSIILKALRMPEYPFEKKVELSKAILIRRMPQKIESDGQTVQVLQVYFPSNEKDLGQITEPIAPVNRTPEIEDKTSISA